MAEQLKERETRSDDADGIPGLPGFGERTAAQLALKTPGRLVVLGTNLVDEFGLPAYEISQGARCVVVTRGTPLAPASASSSEADLPALSAIQ